MGDDNVYMIDVFSGPGSMTGDTSGSFSDGSESPNVTYVIDGPGAVVIRVTSIDSVGNMTTKDITGTVNAATPPPPPPC